jgi:hypothetical protein
MKVRGDEAVRSCAWVMAIGHARRCRGYLRHAGASTTIEVKPEGAAPTNL